MMMKSNDPYEDPVIKQSMARLVELRLGLSEAEFERFKTAANRTWQGIAGDCLDAVRNDPGDGRTSFTRDDVVEITLDAQHMRVFGETNGRRSGNGVEAWESFYDRVIDPWIGKHYGTRAFNELMKEVFPYDEYCD